MARQNQHRDGTQLKLASAQCRAPLIQTVLDLAEAQQVPVYLVGGTVRDLLLGCETHDLDFAVDGDGLRMARHVADALGGAYVSLDPERRTGRVVLRGKDAPHEVGADSLDFASFRGPNLEADLRDRDFTINAMALRRAADGSFALVDPLSGSGDLRHRVLRATSPHAFADDPVRTLRAVRLGVQFGCQIEAQTRGWLVEAVPRLPSISAERLRDEWFRALAQRHAGDAVEQMESLGLLAHIAPPAAALAAIEQPPPARTTDALSHAVETLRAVELLVDALQGQHGGGIELPVAVRPLAPHLLHRYASPICDGRTHLALLKCAALLHNVGLVEPRNVPVAPTGEPAEHAAARSARIASRLARSWRCSNAEVDMLRVTVGAHPRAARLAQQERVDRRAIYRYYRETGEHGIDAAFLALAASWITCRAGAPVQAWQRHAGKLARLWHAFYCEHEDVVDPPPLLSGQDLLHLGMTPGPPMGELIDHIREEQAAGEIETRGEALDAAQAWLAAAREEGT
jgi:hypothetical protein